MLPEKTLKSLEFDKVINAASDFAVLEKTKENLLNFTPVCNLKDAVYLLKKTQEAYKLLYVYSVSGVYFCHSLSEELKRVDAGGTLNCAELLRVAEALKSARLIKTSVGSVNDQEIKYLSEICSSLYVNQEFEKEINEKILSEDRVNDNASLKLSSIRKNIRNLNAKIRERLNSYMRGSNKFLQESVITVRGDRYVIPVKSEYRSSVKGFIHDQSSSGATVFIEPEAVMELNNELKKAMLDEADEIYRILQELTQKVSFMTGSLNYNYQNLVDLDQSFAKATYSFKNKCSLPVLNENGVIDVKKGRHPLIPKEKVVPVSVKLGEGYNFILITGPNTGGKTVSLKLVGLLTLMAMSGLYIPAEDESRISVFSGIYTDIGDEQSIEQSLSTFSSHMSNVKTILEKADVKSLVLLDEIGAGTDPEEGSALALAIIKRLLDLNCFGVITTHYNGLKEFAEKDGRIKNASMQFDSSTLKPLYKLNLGIPGSSNAIDIAKTLGLDQKIISDAINNLSEGKIQFENVLKRAEQSRREAEILSLELDRIKAEKEKELKEISEEKEKIKKEREKIYSNAKAETKRIVSDKLEEAEEIIYKLKSILKAAELESKDLFLAGELKNRLQNSKYLTVDLNDGPIKLVPINPDNLAVNSRVYIKSLSSYGEVVYIKPNKKEAEVRIGNARATVKIGDLFNQENPPKTEDSVKIFRKTSSDIPQRELNVVGKTSLEALAEVANFIDQAVLHNLSEIKIIHGVGEGILLKAIRNYLKTDVNVEEFHRGKYGEGENGVTVVKLK